MQKNLGGDRLGSGNKMKVNLTGYNRSTHDLGALWRSTMSAGTLVPFMNIVGLPGDTFDIDLACEVLTHPTVGPLFGSYKVQLDVFECPIRLYNSLLHNNALKIGMRMSDIKLPTITLRAIPNTQDEENVDQSQINPSCVLAYQGIRGIGYNTTAEERERQFNGTKLLALWDIYKNYYANKQEEIGAVIHTKQVPIIQTVTSITIEAVALPKQPSGVEIAIENGDTIIITIDSTTGTTVLSQIIIPTLEHGELTAEELANDWVENITVPTAVTWTGHFNGARWGTTTAEAWRYKTNSEIKNGVPTVTTFDLNDIDLMRERVLAYNDKATAFSITGQGLQPYSLLEDQDENSQSIQFTQEGLPVKTYQSDLFNNWLSTEWIDGAGGITDSTAISTAAGSFTIDTFVLAKKVWDLDNRVAVSGGTYEDWIDAVYDHERHTVSEIPKYCGGLIRELVFQQVVSNSASEEQPLGTLAGRGAMSGKKKGGKVVIKCDQPCYIIGLVSLTPRIDYSQGNRWDSELRTLDDLHKPALDEIGFQDLLTEQMAWWNTNYNDTTNEWEVMSAGKQPAWMNYMTDYSETFGNFARPESEMFMTLNRRYEILKETGGNSIQDLTTYIDPVKYNFIFADTNLDAMNFWVQIAKDITARRVMSAHIMPRL